MPQAASPPTIDAGLSYRGFAVRADGDRTRAVLSTEQPVEMFDWERCEWVREILLSGGATVPESRQVPMLDSHRRDSLDNQLGSVRNITTSTGAVEGELHFASTDDAQRAKAKVDEGHVTDMSVGYMTSPADSVYIARGQAREINGKTYEGPCNVRIKWRMHEASLVPIGADDMAKVRGFASVEDAIERRKKFTQQNQESNPAEDGGDAARSASGAGATAEGDPGGTNQTRNQNKKMSEPITHDPPAAPARVDTSGELEKLRKAESERVSGIRAIAAKIGKPDFGDKCVADGISVNEARELVLRDHWNSQPTTTSNTYEGADGGFSKSERQDLSKFSILECVRTAMDPRQKVEGIYAECHQEAIAEARECGGSVRGFGIPHKFLRYGQRDATVTGGTGGSQGGVTVATEVRSIIDVFNSRLALKQLGCTMFTGLTGNLSFPKPTKGSDPTEKPENTAGDEYDATWGAVNLSPHRLPIYTDVSNQLTKQNSVDVENWLRNQIGVQLAVRMEKKALNGTGSSSEPNGLLNASGIGGVTTSGTLTWPLIVEFESDIDSSDALMGSLGWLCTPAVKAEAKTTVKASGTAVYLCENDTMNGYPVVSSTIVPAQHLIFGNWQDLYCAMWGGLDLTVDNLTLAREGLVRLVWETFYDVACARAQSFSIATDV